MTPSDEPPPLPADRPRAGTVRSRLMLEVASELVGLASWPQKQARVQLRSQGEDRWSVTLFGSDSALAAREVANGDAQFAIVNPATAIGPAIRGLPPFERASALSAIGTIPSHDQLGLAVAAHFGITRLDELRTARPALRLSLRAQRDHSIHMVVAHVLGAVGVTLDDLVSWGGVIRYDEDIPHRGARAAAIAAGEIDAVFDEGTYNWVDLATRSGLLFLALAEPELRALEAMGYRRATLSARRHPSLSKDVATLDFSGFLVYTRADMPDDVVTAFCAALVARRDRIPWQGGPSLPLERMVSDATDAPIPIPLHPAAARFWRARGAPMEGVTR